MVKLFKSPKTCSGLKFYWCRLIWNCKSTLEYVNCWTNQANIITHHLRPISNSQFESGQYHHLKEVSQICSLFHGHHGVWYRYTLKILEFNFFLGGGGLYNLFWGLVYSIYSTSLAQTKAATHIWSTHVRTSHDVLWLFYLGQRHTTLTPVLEKELPRHLNCWPNFSLFKVHMIMRGSICQEYYKQNNLIRLLPGQGDNSSFGAVIRETPRLVAVIKIDYIS